MIRPLRRLVFIFVFVSPAVLLPIPLLTAQAPTHVLLMLQNIQSHGLNSSPKINSGLGGLYINWRTTSTPLQTNFKGDGTTDAPTDPLRHDILTDLRYQHNLLLYKSQHPTDHQFDTDLTRFRSIVKLEFTNSHNERGWLYDELIDMYRISGDDLYRQQAHDLAKNFATALYKEPAGIYFKTNKLHPHGYYRIDQVIQAGCALVQAAREFHEPDWDAKGRRMVDFVYTHAYLTKYRTFAFMMDEVLLPDGSLNPNEKIYYDDTGRYAIEGGIVRMGSLGQIITSLFHAGYIDRAKEMLDALTPEQNLLGLWDAKNLGYFNAVLFPGGHTLQDPGQPKLSADKKESGRQAHMLEAVMVANRLTNNRYKSLESEMMKVVLEKAYYAPGHGILYEMTPDWKLLPLKKGGHEDWVTSEAMGIALEALQQKNQP